MKQPCQRCGQDVDRETWVLTWGLCGKCHTDDRVLGHTSPHSKGRYGRQAV